MGASSRTLEITVISGENLHVDNNPVTEDAYVVVRTESINCCTTQMAKEDGGSPNSNLLSWNEKFLLDIPMHARSITFEVQCKKYCKGARPVGVARIALSDFLGGSMPENCLQVLSYRLRDWGGRRNGVIHFAVRVVMPEERSLSVAEPAKRTVASERDSIHGGDKNANGVVIGTPIWWNSPNNI